MSNLKSMFSGITEDTKSFSDNIDKLILQYPVGSGSWGVLDREEKEAETYFIGNQAELEGTQEGLRLQTAIGKLRALLESEMNISSQQQIDAGQSTVEEEQKKKDMHNQERIRQNLTPLAPAKGGIFGTILLIGALGAGAYFIFK